MTSLLRMLAPPMTAPLCSLSKMPRHLQRGREAAGRCAVRARKPPLERAPASGRVAACVAGRVAGCARVSRSRARGTPDAAAQLVAVLARAEGQGDAVAKVERVVCEGEQLRLVRARVRVRVRVRVRS